MGSATEQVSVLINWMIVAVALTGLLQIEGDSIGASMSLMASCGAAPLPLVVPKDLAAAGALVEFRLAHVSTLPHSTILAPIHALTVLQ